jgi:hypothetical protein
MTSTEKNYAQIEKELLAILIACKRFEQYILGNQATVRTDHKSLINIFNKSLLNAPKRLQMMMLYLQRYNIKLEYLPGKRQFIADTLPRAPDPELQAKKFDIIRLSLMMMNCGIL